MIIYLLAQLFLVLFNLLNAANDAARIKKNKRIYHSINFGAYALFCMALCWFAHWDIGVITLFCVSAFFQRQLSFDIPLNLRRGLKWDYVSLAKPPKALLDKIEIRLFGYNGRAPVFMYAALWMACLIIKIFIK